MSQYSFWNSNQIINFSNYCQFPKDEHRFPFTFFIFPSLSTRSLLGLEQLILHSYKFYTAYTDPSRSYTTIPGIVDLIKKQDGDVINYSDIFMAPFLPEYSRGEVLLTPPLEFPFLSVKQEFLMAFNKISKSIDFKKRFIDFMGERAKETCPQCCLYLIILMIKSSFLHYHHHYYSITTDDPFYHERFNLYLTQILLGCKPGIDNWTRRHSFIHKTYSIMIETPHFLKTIGMILEKLNELFIVSIDDDYFKQLSVCNFWANIPSFTDPKHNPTQKIIDFMLNNLLWTMDEYVQNKGLYKLAIRLLFHHNLYAARTYRTSVYHTWVDTNTSKSSFLVVFERNNFPNVVFVRFNKAMISAINKR